jgi:hypothetical protein
MCSVRNLKKRHFLMPRTAQTSITDFGRISPRQGLPDGDFEFLTGQLARLIIESDNPFTPWQKTAQLKLISEMFALREFHIVVARGALVSLAFSDLPTKH